MAIGLALVLAAATPVVAPVPASLDANTTLVPGSMQRDRQPDGNSIVMVGPKGVIVFDTGRHPAHTQVVADVVAKTGKPLVAIVNSHWHLDHVSGNLVLKAANPGVKVYASNAIDGALVGFLPNSAKGAREYMAKEGDKIPPETLEDLHNDFATIDNGAKLKPDMVVQRDQVVTLGGRRISLRIASHAATEGDVWIYDAAAQRVLAGDLVTLPAPFFDTACPDGWRKALDSLASTRFKQLVPGHGAPMAPAAFATYRTAFGRFVDCARSDRPTAECASAWASDVAPLLKPGEEGRAKGMAGYYAGLIRGGGLKQYCDG